MEYKSTILIVDDDPFGRRTLGTLLTGPDYNYILAFATNGIEALQQAADLTPDLILLDVMMPDMDGFEVCRRLRSDSQLAEVPVIIVTALDDRDSRLQGIEAGADDIVSKPFDPVELRTRVRTITRLNRYRRLLIEREALRESEKHLRRSRDLLRLIFDNLEDSLLLLNQDGCVLAMNQSMGTLLGSRPDALDELTSQPWTALCHRSDPPFPGTSALKTLQDGRARRNREHYTSQNGQMRMLDIQILPLIGPEQTVDQVIVHVIDVTERLQLEALVIQNEHFAARGRLAATVAHEVNTPLQSIRNCLYLAGKAQGQQRDTYLELASEELERISTIVRKLLDVKHHGDESTPALINLNTLIERVLLLTGGTLASYGIDIERNFSPTRPMVFGYANHLTQVLLNIILNAVDAMPDGGKLYLNTRSDTLKPETSRQPAFQSNTGGFSATLDAIESVQPAGGQDIVMIEITDTGCGIPPEIQSRMFDPFFTTKASGSGVGLAISQQIVVQHGGQINVHSTPGHGSTFRIILPSGSLTAASPTSGEDEDKENPG